MSLMLAEKQAVVAEVAEVAKAAHSAVAAEYRGLTVSQLTALRVEARKNDVYLRVVKNTLARRAVAGTQFECMADQLLGPLILAFSRKSDDIGAAARVFKDFLKDKANDKLVVKLLALDGQAMPGSALNQVASLPSKDQAISLLMAVMKAPVGKLAATLAAVRQQKEDAAA